MIGLWCCCWPSLMSFVITNKTVLIHKSWSEGHAAKSRLLTGQEPILVPCCGKSTVLSSVPGLCFLRFYVLCCSEEPCSPGWSVAAGGTIIELLLQPVFIKIFFTFFPFIWLENRQKTSEFFGVNYVTIVGHDGRQYQGSSHSYHYMTHKHMELLKSL